MIKMYRTSLAKNESRLATKVGEVGKRCRGLVQMNDMIEVFLCEVSLVADIMLGLLWSA